MYDHNSADQYLKHQLNNTTKRRVHKYKQKMMFPVSVRGKFCDGTLRRPEIISIETRARLNVPPEGQCSPVSS